MTKQTKQLPRTKTQEYSEVRYCYLKDPKDQRRVMAIGTRLTSGQVEWVTAINNPADRFEKKMAHVIINGRFERGKTHGEKSLDGGRPLEIVVRSIANKEFLECDIASRIAKAHLPDFEKVTMRKQLDTELLCDKIVTSKRPSARAKVVAAVKNKTKAK